jgi:HK97 family phage major capsid protein
MSDPFVDVENIVMSDVQESMTLDENTSFITGDSINKPRGILDYPAWTTAGTYERGALEQINSGTSAKVTFDGLVDVQNSLLEIYQPNAVWLMSRTTYGAICKLKDQSGQPYVGGYGKYLRDGSSIDVPMVLSKPVVFCSDMPELAAGSLSIAYGDFKKGYTILDRMGISVLQNPYKLVGQMGFYFRKRVGAGVTNYQAIKIMKASA